MYLIFDAHNLAYRAFYTTGGLHYRGTSTGVAYGMLGTIIQLQGEFGPSTCIFCFDSKYSHRRLMTIEYKQNRNKESSLTPEQVSALWDLRSQIRRLREDYLPQIGFRNIFRKKGFEADDLMASVVLNMPKDEDATIVSSDGDMLQLLSRYVQVYDPKKKFTWTVKRFIKHYGILPKDWIQVKALAGCPSDGVKGIPRVGEKTAIAYITGKLNVTSKASFLITSKEGQAIHKRNLPLVTLPFPGVGTFTVKPEGTLDWKPTLAELDIKKFDGQIQYRPLTKKGK